jgi:cation:H+ antiporter
LEALCFFASLGLTMFTAALFTRRLEAICDRLELSAGVLSLLGALGANIPNYVASIDAIARGSSEVGLGIIIGSNIYNIAIILGLATFAMPERKGFLLSLEEARQVRGVGVYTLTIMLTTLLLIALLFQRSARSVVATSPLISGLLLLTALVELGIFVLLAWHVLRRPHPVYAEKHDPEAATMRRRSLRRLVIEALLALAVALGGVLVMVQTGQDVTTEMHMAPALAGLLVLAIATSLPNTVVAIILVRTGRAAACVEEIFSSNSVNAVLGIALPLLFWSSGVHDPLLLILDVPLMVLLTLWAWLWARRGRFQRSTGAVLLLSYIIWIGVHLFI